MGNERGILDRINQPSPKATAWHGKIYRMGTSYARRLHVVLEAVTVCESMFNTCGSPFPAAGVSRRSEAEAKGCDPVLWIHRIQRIRGLILSEFPYYQRRTAKNHPAIRKILYAKQLQLLAFSYPSYYGPKVATEMATGFRGS